MSSESPLFGPIMVGEIALKNRIVMAPLTRCRAYTGDCTGPLNAEYYTQRASAGLIISEATQISPQGKGYLHTPGIYNKEQIDGWKQVTDAVHRQQGKIVAQLWHVGRISHPDFQLNGELPVAPSAIKPEGHTFTQHGSRPFVTPRALEHHEIPDIIQQYAHAAECAKQAGFDGVEIHAANGYLLDQFLRDKTNTRTDEYGGSIENRMRLILQVVDTVTTVWGAQRVGIRISPSNTTNDISDSNPQETFKRLVEQLNRFNLAYLHCIEGGTRSELTSMDPVNYVLLRQMFQGKYIANNGYTLSRAHEALRDQHADLISFGRLYLANPDLVERFKINAPCANAPMSIWYTGGAKGYTDWTTLDQSTPAS